MKRWDMLKEPFVGSKSLLVRTLMLEFQKQGLTLTFERVFVQRLLSYVCFSHNNFNLVQGSNKTPREIAVGSKVSQDCFALFGSKVLAEVPQSILERSPNMPRFISAAFIHPEFQSSGSVVIGKIQVGREMITRCFVAKSFKLVLPFEIRMSLVFSPNWLMNVQA